MNSSLTSSQSSRFRNVCATRLAAAAFGAISTLMRSTPFCSFADWNACSTLRAVNPLVSGMSTGKKLDRKLYLPVNELISCMDVTFSLEDGERLGENSARVVEVLTVTLVGVSVASDVGDL